MSIASRLGALSLFLAAPFFTACGSDSGTSCDASNLCTAGYVCISGQCELDDTGTSGGDGTTPTDDGDPGATDEDEDGDVALTDEDYTAGDADLSDVTGPVILVNSPTSDQMVGKSMYVSITVTDDSGIDSSTVAAFVGASATGQSRIDIPLAQDSGGAYTAIFPTTDLQAYFTFPYFGVRARDNEGNETNTGFYFSIDTTPPRVGFSSPDVQSQNVDGACSVTWPPLGNRATNYLLSHGAVYHNVNAIPRLRIQDEGNFREPVGVNAGIDADLSKVYFVAYHSGVAKLVQTSDGTTCDTINPILLPSPEDKVDEAVVYDLVPFTQDHATYFRAGDNGGTCVPTSDGTDTTDPGDVCLGAAPVDGIRRWLTYDLGSPAIYGLLGYEAEDYSVFCSGGVFDTYNMPAGPVCAAALVTDNVGNVTVTKPIAFCVDRGGTECDSFDTTTADSIAADCGGSDCTSPDWASYDITVEQLR